MWQGTTEQQGKIKVLCRKACPEAFINFYCSCFASKLILRKNKSGPAPVVQTIVLKEQTTQKREDERELKKNPNTKVPRKLLKVRKTTIYFAHFNYIQAGFKGTESISDLKWLHVQQSHTTTVWGFKNLAKEGGQDLKIVFKITKLIHQLQRLLNRANSSRKVLWHFAVWQVSNKDCKGWKATQSLFPICKLGNSVIVWALHFRNAKFHLCP